MLTGADKGIWNEDLLCLSPGTSGRWSVRVWCRTWTTGRTSPRAGLSIRARSGAWVSFLVFKEDGSDIVHGDMDGIGDTGDRKDTLFESAIYA